MNGSALGLAVRRWFLHHSEDDSGSVVSYSAAEQVGLILEGGEAIADVLRVDLDGLQALSVKAQHESGLVTKVSVAPTVSALGQQSAEAVAEVHKLVASVGTQMGQQLSALSTGAANAAQGYDTQEATSAQALNASEVLGPVTGFEQAAMRVAGSIGGVAGSLSMVTGSGGGVIGAAVRAVSQVAPSGAPSAGPVAPPASPTTSLRSQLQAAEAAQVQRADSPPTPAQNSFAPQQLATPSPSPTEPASPPAAPQNDLPAPSTRPAAPGVQLMGFGSGGAPQAPPLPVPRDPPPPVPPPPPIEEMTEEQAREAWDKLKRDKASYTARCDPSIVGRLPPGPYSACVREFNELNAREAALRARLNQLGVPIEDTPTRPGAPGVDPAPGQQEPPEATGNPPQRIDEVPLQSDLGQIERKFKHAPEFGVTDPRGRAGFDNFDKALRRFVDDPATVHIQGTYRGQPAILNYNSNSGLCVIQTPDGNFVSGFQLSPEQAWNVVNRGVLGGGD